MLRESIKPHISTRGSFKDLREHLHGVFCDKKKVLKFNIAQMTQAMIKYAYKPF